MYLEPPEKLSAFGLVAETKAIDTNIMAIRPQPLPDKILALLFNLSCFKQARMLKKNMHEYYLRAIEGVLVGYLLI